MKIFIKKILFWLLTTTLTIFIVTNIPVHYFNLYQWVSHWLNKNHLGSTVTTISSTDIISNFPTVFNTDINNLNTDKLESGSTAALLTVTGLTTSGITQSGSATSTFAGGISTLRIDGSATSTFNGIQLTSGCLLYKGSCLTTTVSSVSNSDSSLTISPTSGAVVASLNLAHSNIWSALQIYSYAATSTFAGDINSGGLIAANYFDATSTTATSTLRGGTIMDYASTTNMTVSGKMVGALAGSYERNSNTCALNGGSPSSCAVTLTCSAGKYVTGGGTDGISNQAAGSNYKVDSYPTANNVWQCDFGGPNGDTNTMTCYQICVNK